MTNAADAGAVVPTAPVFAEGAFCDSSYPYRSQIASNAPAMMSKRNSQLARSPFIQALIDIGAILFAAFFICLVAIAIAVAIAVPLFVNLKF